VEDHFRIPKTRTRTASVGAPNPRFRAYAVNNLVFKAVAEERRVSVKSYCLVAIIDI